MSQLIHPYAELFPMLSDRELADLAADIKANGQSHRIILDQHGRLVDGRNRLRACELAGVEPLTETREFEDDAAVLRFVVSVNIHRRHLDESQRAMVAASIANMKRGDNQHAQISATSQSEAAELLNVSRGSVQHAKQVITQGTPELQQAVKDGEIKVSKAAAIAKRPKEEQDREMAERKKGKPKAKPTAKEEPKRPPKVAVAPDIGVVLAEIRQMSLAALKEVCSTSSATWSNKAQHVFLSRILYLLDKFQ